MIDDSKNQLVSIVFLLLNEHLTYFSVISQIGSILCSIEITVFV